MTPYLMVAWTLVRDINHERRIRLMKFHLPAGRFAWCLVGLALVLLAALIVSLVLTVGRPSKPQASNCYVSASTGGFTFYMASPNTSDKMAFCNTAAKDAGVTPIPSLPGGVQKVCTSGTVSVYMKPQDITTIKNNGLNPAAVCQGKS